MSIPWPYWVPKHPVPLCEEFVAQPAPAQWWCATCGWHLRLHDDDTAREAIAAELARIGGTA